MRHRNTKTCSSIGHCFPPFIVQRGLQNTTRSAPQGHHILLYFLFITRHARMYTRLTTMDNFCSDLALLIRCPVAATAAARNQVLNNFHFANVGMMTVSLGP